MIKNKKKIQPNNLDAMGAAILLFAKTGQKKMQGRQHQNVSKTSLPASCQI